MGGVYKVINTASERMYNHLFAKNTLRAIYLGIYNTMKPLVWKRHEKKVRKNAFKKRK